MNKHKKQDAFFSVKVQYTYGHGFLTHGLDNKCKNVQSIYRTVVFVCGPMPVLKKTAIITELLI